MNFPERLEVGRLAGVKTQLGKSDMFPPPSHRNGTFSFGCLGKGCPFPGGRFILRAMLVASEDTLFECCGIHFITAANPSVACGIPVFFYNVLLQKDILYFLQYVILQIFTLDIYLHAGHFTMFVLNKLGLSYCAVRFYILIIFNIR